MQSKATTPKAYIDSLPADRAQVVKKIRAAIVKNLPKGFSEIMNYGIMGWVVPHSLYPDGYHVNPKDPLPFIGLASQKHFIALYHMGLYSDPVMLQWFKDLYPERSKGKLDMGKSCIRFKKFDQIPYDLIGELASKMTPKDYITLYEKNRKKSS
jgi:hypothetical protein